MKPGQRLSIGLKIKRKLDSGKSFQSRWQFGGIVGKEELGECHGPNVCVVHIQMWNPSPQHEGLRRKRGLILRVEPLWKGLGTSQRVPWRAPSPFCLQRVTLWCCHPQPGRGLSGDPQCPQTSQDLQPPQLWEIIFVAPKPVCGPWLQKRGWTTGEDYRRTFQVV